MDVGGSSPRAIGAKKFAPIGSSSAATVLPANRMSSVVLDVHEACVDVLTSASLATVNGDQIPARLEARPRIFTQRKCVIACGPTVAFHRQHAIDINLHIIIVMNPKFHIVQIAGRNLHLPAHPNVRGVPHGADDGARRPVGSKTALASSPGRIHKTGPGPTDRPGQRSCSATSPGIHPPRTLLRESRALWESPPSSQLWCDRVPPIFSTPICYTAVPQKLRRPPGEPVNRPSSHFSSHTNPSWENGSLFHSEN